jgi:signal transduction histidine kinase
MRHDQLTLEVDVPKDLPLIECRNQQIRQVVMNLLTNARDALNQKYPKHDANKKILITARAFAKDGRTWLRTTVEDHGPGIPEELRVRIFDPFFSTKPRDRGTGLGLSISHSIVKDHGGTLGVESEVGQWTRFHMDLPVE